MKNRNKNSKYIAFISVLAGIAYLYLISIDFINDWDSSVNSFWQGYNASAKARTNELKESPFSLHLRAKDMQHYYSDSLMNLKNDKYLPAKSQQVEVLYQFNDYDEYRAQLKYNTVIFIITFVLLILLIAVPVFFYKIIGAFYKNKIFNYRNVRRLNILGVLLIIIFAILISLDIIYFHYKKSLIDIPNYSLYVYLSNAEWLFMGLITLLIASVLKRSVEMKEEQDLTI
ncbi:MAG: DUF2975 domain-containing protein [Fermentimonas sp.]|nr:DUF2975 domain-containing protein [Fermentimonas sp.]